MSLDAPVDVVGQRVLVTGLTAAGFAAADALLERGADVTVLRPSSPATAERERAEILVALGATVLDVPVSGELPGALGPSVDLVVLGAGEEADRSLVATGALRALDVPICTEAEVAWRLRPEATPWLVVGGGPRRRVVTELCARILTAAGRGVVVAGGDDRPVVEALRVGGPGAVVLVDASPWDARHSAGLAAFASAWIGDGAREDPAALQAAAEATYAGTVSACLYAAADAVAEAALHEADVVEGCRAVAVGTGVPPVAALGLVEDVLCDRGFHPQRQTSALELAGLDDVEVCFDGLSGPAPVAWVLMAAGLARSVGAPAGAVRAALRDAQAPPPGAPRVLGRDPVGALWITDGGAETSPAAANALLATAADVVWIASAQALRSDVGGAVLASVAGRLRAVLVLSARTEDADAAAAQVARHAPEVPARTLPLADTDDVSDLHDATTDHVTRWAAGVVDVAAGFVGEGAAVVWAPGATVGVQASGAPLGDAFARAVRERLGRGR